MRIPLLILVVPLLAGCAALLDQAGAPAGLPKLELGSLPAELTREQLDMYSCASGELTMCVCNSRIGDCNCRCRLPGGSGGG